MIFLQILLSIFFFNSPDTTQNKKSNFHHPQTLTLNKNSDDFFKLPKPLKTEVWILIVDPGNSLFSTFGHSAFLIRYPSGKEKVFDFGNFSLEDGFIGKVIKNRAFYFTEKKDFSYFLDLYQSENREIRGLKLNLTENRINFLVKRLEQIINSSEKTYIYEHFTNNCTTKMRDLLAQTIKGNFREKLQNIKEFSWRKNLNKILSQSFWLKHSLNFLLSSLSDKNRNTWDGMFLPSIMEKVFLKLKIKQQPFANPKPLVSKYMTVLKGEKQYFKTPKYIPAIFVGILFIILIPVTVWRYGILFKVTLFIYSLFQTTLFIALLIMHIYHPVSAFNLNLLSVFPFLMLIFPLWKNSDLKTNNNVIKLLIISFIFPLIPITLRPITIQHTFPYPEAFIFFTSIFLFVAISIRLNFKKSLVQMTNQIKIIKRNK